LPGQRADHTGHAAEGGIGTEVEQLYFGADGQCSEVDDHVGSFTGSEQQLSGLNDCGQESAVTADLVECSAI
jgi:hypothetical protein